MKVLHISGLRAWGGIFTFVNELAAYQRAHQGVDSAVLSVLSGAEDFERAMESVVPVHKAGLKSGWDADVRKYVRILRIMRQYDILHFHGFYPGVVACALLSRRVIVHTEHGTFQEANLRLSLMKFVKKRLLGFSFLEYGTDAVVFISEWLKQNLGLRRARCFVIHNGTAAKGRPRSEPRSGGSLRVLGLGRFVIRKRFDRLIRGFGMAADQSNMSLTLVGDGPLEAELKTLAASCLRPQGYEFRGYVPDVSSFYDAADLVVVPTEFEPFGLVAVEAALSAIPVVCFRDGGGVLEVIGGVHERLIVDDEADLARALEYWRDRPDERRAVGLRLYERAREHFRLERMADDYLRLYGLLNAPGDTHSRRAVKHAPLTHAAL